MSPSLAQRPPWGAAVAVRSDRFPTCISPMASAASCPRRDVGSLCGEPDKRDVLYRHHPGRYAFVEKEVREIRRNYLVVPPGKLAVHEVNHVRKLGARPHIVDGDVVAIRLRDRRLRTSLAGTAVIALWSHQPGYAEARRFGDPTGSLAFSSQTTSTVTGALGLRGKYDMPMSWGVFSPRARVEYNHAFQRSGSATLQFADWLSGPSYAITPGLDQSDTALIGLGTDVRLEQGLFLAFDYQTTLGLHYGRSHLFVLKLGGQY